MIETVKSILRILHAKYDCISVEMIQFLISTISSMKSHWFKREN